MGLGQAACGSSTTWAGTCTTNRATRDSSPRRSALQADVVSFSAMTEDSNLGETPSSSGHHAGGAVRLHRSGRAPAPRASELHELFAVGARPPSLDRDRIPSGVQRRDRRAHRYTDDQEGGSSRLPADRLPCCSQPLGLNPPGSSTTCWASTTFRDMPAVCSGTQQARFGGRFLPNIGQSPRVSWSRWPANLTFGSPEVSRLGERPGPDEGGRDARRPSGYYGSGSLRPAQADSSGPRREPRSARSVREDSRLTRDPAPRAGDPRQPCAVDAATVALSSSLRPRSSSITANESFGSRTMGGSFCDAVFSNCWTCS